MTNTIADGSLMVCMEKDRTCIDLDRKDNVVWTGSQEQQHLSFGWSALSVS